MGSTSKRYTAEFRADAIALVRSSPGRSITEIAKSIGAGPESLRNWVKQDATNRGEGPEGALTSADKDELHRLRKEIAELRVEKEILSKAAAFFAREMMK